LSERIVTLNDLHGQNILMIFNLIVNYFTSDIHAGVAIVSV